LREVEKEDFGKQEEGRISRVGAKVRHKLRLWRIKVRGLEFNHNLLV